MDDIRVLDVSTDPTTTVFELSGELDIASVAVLTTALADTAGAPHVVLDLGGLTFIDSTGIAALVTASQAAYRRGGWLKVRSANGIVERAMTITGVLDLLVDPTGFAEPSWSVDGASA